MYLGRGVLGSHADAGGQEWGFVVTMDAAASVGLLRRRMGGQAIGDEPGLAEDFGGGGEQWAGDGELSEWRAQAQDGGAVCERVRVRLCLAAPQCICRGVAGAEFS